MGYELGPDGFIRRTTPASTYTPPLRPVPTGGSGRQFPPGVLIFVVIVIIAIVVIVGLNSSKTSSNGGTYVPPAVSSVTVPPNADSADLSPTGYIQALSARVDNLEFFQAGYVAPGKAERVYNSAFQADESATGLVVYWELNLSHPTRGGRQAFIIYVCLYGPDGTLKSQTQVPSYVEPAWQSSFHFAHWPEAMSAWEPGSYRVSLFVDGIKVAGSVFTITPDPQRGRRAEGLVAEAHRLYEQRQYKEAVEACDGAIKSDPGNSEAIQLRAQILRTIQLLGVE